MSQSPTPILETVSPVFRLATGTRCHVALQRRPTVGPSSTLGWNISVPLRILASQMHSCDSRHTAIIDDVFVLWIPPLTRTFSPPSHSIARCAGNFLTVLAGLPLSCLFDVLIWEERASVLLWLQLRLFSWARTAAADVLWCFLRMPKVVAP